MPSPSPVVSIVMATYNFERFLPRALDSALAQDYPADCLDIVVIDDGSTDSTPEVVEPYLDRIRYIRKPNGGLLTTVNRGLAEARGEFISLLSGDDEFLPGKTRAQVDFLLANPEVGLVYADMETVDDEGHVLHPSFWRQSNIVPERGRVLGKLIGRNCVSGGALMVRSSLKERFAPIPETAAWEDWYIAVRVAEVAEIDYLPQAVYRYRHHGANMNLGTTGDKLVPLLREEAKFRRSLMSTIEPGGVTVAELLHGYASFNGVVTTIGEMSGTSLQEVVVVSDEQRKRSRELLTRARGTRGDTAAFAYVNALALDPWNAEAQSELQSLLSPPSIDGVRSFSALAFADELVAAPEMLSAYAATFGADADATLVILGEGDQFDALGETLATAGLDGDDAPDMLAVPREDGMPQSLAHMVRAVYSRRAQDGPLEHRPRMDDSGVDALRALAVSA